MINKYDKEFLIECLKDGKEIPETFKYALFPTKQKEYELVYSGKMRKEDLLSNEDGVFPVPLQIEKIFNGSEHSAFDDDWKNMIVFGDNLQFLKTIYENRDPLIKDKVKGKIKLIYIDPPFATADDFSGSRDQKAYTDKRKHAQFVEFIRRRLILAKEILSDDGSILIHLDEKKIHYIKILMDEIFGENSFVNEIIWNKGFRGTESKGQYQQAHETILFYTKGENYTWNQQYSAYKDLKMGRYNKTDEDGKRYALIKRRRTDGTVYYGKTYVKKEGKNINDFIEIEYDEIIDVPVMASTSKERLNYPTQKPEELIKLLILQHTSEGDIVLDFFGGSGTTMAVAEKLNRKWITCDLGKLAYLTMQKRILQIQNSKDLDDIKKKYEKKAKSFTTCTLGLYDFKKVLNLEWTKYLEFVSGLFEIELKKHKVSGFEFDGKKGSYSVKIWDYNTYKNSNIDEAYLKNIHQIIGGKINGRIYIIAPANNIEFLTDYHEIEGLRYYFLKIPYQVIRELHKIPFQKIRQPQSKKNVNDLDETIGFHFIKAPEVKSVLKKVGDEIQIVIKEFRSQYYKDEEGEIFDNFETLSAVFVDKKFDNKQFILTDSFFADDLLPKKKVKEVEDEQDDNKNIRAGLKEMKNEELKITFKKKEIGKKIMIVYTDIYGNDFTEIFTV